MSPAGDVGPGLTVAALVLASAALVAPARPARSGATRRAARRWSWRRPSRTRRGEEPDPDQAVADVAERAAALLRAGLSPEQAWRHADTSDGVGETAALQAVRRLLTQTGAPAVQALDAVAAGLREDAAARAAVRTGLAGAKVSARTVSALPVLGLVLGAALGAEPWHVLFGTAPGRICAVVGTGLLVLGRWWSARLVRRAGAGP